MQRLRYSRYLKSLVILADIMTVIGVFVFFYAQNHVGYFSDIISADNCISGILLLFLWILLSGRTKLYSVPRNLTFTLYLERVVTHILLFIIGVVLLARVSNNEFLKYESFWNFSVLSFMILMIKSILFFSLKYWRSKGKNYRNAMLLFEDASVGFLRDTLLSRKDYGFRIIDYPQKNIEIEKLKQFWHEQEIHTIFLPSERRVDKKTEEALFEEAERSKIKICLVPPIIQPEFFDYELSYIATQPILSPAKFPLDYYSNFLIKRTFDIIFSLFVLVFVCSWLFPIIMILIKLDSKGAVFFRQKRYGYHDEVFECIKFRTMVDNPFSSTKTTEINDHRVTSIGRFLRRTSLDEFPQFFNVLMGTMSVIGPRPHMLAVDDYYKPKIGRYAIRSMIKPGITGLAQVSGFRGSMGDADAEMKKRILADAFYVKNWSLSLDIVIILKTFFILIIGDKKAY